MTAPPSPLLGYNTNIRHKGKLYHIQTEDSGVNRPHIITHLFADGGRIVASTKTLYGQHVGSAGLHDLVKAQMQLQHKAMLIALRDGLYDESSDSTGAMRSPVAPVVSAVPAAAAAAEAPAAVKPALSVRTSGPDPEALDRAADAKIASSVAFRTRRRRRHRVAVSAQDVPSRPPRARKMPQPPAKSPHGSRRSARKTALDEVMLSYLADEDGDPPSGKR